CHRAGAIAGRSLRDSRDAALDCAGLGCILSRRRVPRLRQYPEPTAGFLRASTARAGARRIGRNPGFFPVTLLARRPAAELLQLSGSEQKPCASGCASPSVLGPPRPVYDSCGEVSDTKYGRQHASNHHPIAIPGPATKAAGGKPDVTGRL